MIRDPHCTLCHLSQEAEGRHRCVVPPNHRAEIMVVTKYPANSDEIYSLLQSVGLDDREIYLTSAIKCETWSLEPSSADVKTCRIYLNKEIATVKPRWILTLGNEALLAATGHSGIMKHRGKLYPHKSSADVQCFGTLNPVMVSISPGYEKGFRADLRLFASMVTGKAVKQFPKVPFRRAMNFGDIEELMTDLTHFAWGAAFDIESNMFDEWKPDSKMVSISFTLWDKKDTDPRVVWAVPLCHPQSPFKGCWRDMVALLIDGLLNCKVRVAHNAKFDCRWLTEFYEETVTATFCTMIAAHLIDENRSKALASLSREELGIADWKIPNTNLMNEPLLRVLKYNAEDTLNTARLYFEERKQLLELPEALRLFQILMMPASNMFVEVERTGVWVDRPLLNERWAIIKKRLGEIDQKLKEWIPDDPPFSVNFNPSHFLRWWLFEELGLPILARGKSGLPSFSEVIKWRLEDKHPVVPLLIERGELVKFDTSFFGAYDELMDENDRIHTTFKITGTVTGRLASGKADETKVQARPERGINLQQVPRDPFVRGVIGSRPGTLFISADYSQVEFRIGAMLANETTALELYRTGGDVHLAMAVALTGKAPEEIVKEERKRAKWVNFGYLYGMQWRTFIETVWRGYQIKVPEVEAKKNRKVFFDTYPGFLRWHEECRKIARRDGCVKTLMGRIRHLPNIRSSKADVRAEAERQAINSPVQGLASDLNLFGALLVNEIAKAQNLRLKILGTVHDEALYECDERDVSRALPLIHRTMETLPLKRYFGVELTVPLVANLSCKRHWKEGAEDKDLTLEEIYDWKAAT